MSGIRIDCWAPAVVRLNPEIHTVQYNANFFSLKLLFRGGVLDAVTWPHITPPSLRKDHKRSLDWSDQQISWAKVLIRRWVATLFISTVGHFIRTQIKQIKIAEKERARLECSANSVRLAGKLIYEWLWVYNCMCNMGESPIARI